MQARRPRSGDCADALLFVIPAKAGIHSSTARVAEKWVPAFAGMTLICIAQPYSAASSLTAAVSKKRRPVARWFS
jgi:hypothetical protein